MKENSIMNESSNNTKRKRLFLHIGMHKTATSAIQNFLCENESALLKNGYCYAKSGFNNSDHNKLGFALAKEMCDNGYYNYCLSYKDCSSLDGQFSEICKSLREEILYSRINNFIVSSDSLYILMVDQKAISILKKYLSGVDIYVVLYLRRQDIWLESLYLQVIKSNRTCCSFDDFCNPLLERGWANYLMLVKALNKNFNNLIIRIYEKRQLKNGNIYNDFIESLGIKDFKWFYMPEHTVNPSLDMKQYLIMKELNRLPISNETLLKMSIHLRDLKTSKPFGNHNIVSPRKRLDIIEKFRSSNAELAKFYFNRADGNLFFLPEPDQKEISLPKKTFNESEVNEIIATVNDLWLTNFCLNGHSLKNSNRIFPDIRKAMMKMAQRIADDGHRYVAVYGTGECGCLFINVAQKYDLEIPFIIDSNKAMYGRYINDIKILDITQAAAYDFDCYALATLTFKREMVQVICSHYLASDIEAIPPIYSTHHSYNEDNFQYYVIQQ